MLYFTHNESTFEEHEQSFPFQKLHTQADAEDLFFLKTFLLNHLLIFHKAADFIMSPHYQSGSFMLSSKDSLPVSRIDSLIPGIEHKYNVL